MIAPAPAPPVAFAPSAPADSSWAAGSSSEPEPAVPAASAEVDLPVVSSIVAVSYTPMTLPTILSGGQSRCAHSPKHDTLRNAIPYVILSFGIYCDLKILRW